MPQPHTAGVLIPILEGRRGRRRAGAEKRHPFCSGRSTCRLTTTVRRHSIPITLVARPARVGDWSCALCLRLQCEYSLRSWGLTARGGGHGGGDRPVGCASEDGCS